MGPLCSYLVQSLKSSLQASSCSLLAHWAIMVSSTSGTWSSDCKKHIKSRPTQWVKCDSELRRVGWAGLRWLFWTLSALLHVQTCMDINRETQVRVKLIQTQCCSGNEPKPAQDIFLIIMWISVFYPWADDSTASMSDNLVSSFIFFQNKNSLLHIFSLFFE